jgi:hypothetical protein
MPAVLIEYKARVVWQMRPNPLDLHQLPHGTTRYLCMRTNPRLLLSEFTHSYVSHGGNAERCFAAKTRNRRT